MFEMKPTDERKRLEYIKSKNARKINNIIQKLKYKNLIYEDMISDTYHTFDDLYFQRCILFATICNQNKDISWKSKKHNDNTMYDNYFIVGIKTPKGDYTYHYHMQFWDYFDIKEIDKAPIWDGHTDKDVTRLLSLGGGEIMFKTKSKYGLYTDEKDFEKNFEQCLKCLFENKKEISELVLKKGDSARNVVIKMVFNAGEIPKYTIACEKFVKTILFGKEK